MNLSIKPSTPPAAPQGPASQSPTSLAMSGVTLQQVAEQKEAIEAYVKRAASKSDRDRQDLNKEKTGVFTGAYAINPVNGQPVRSIPGLIRYLQDNGGKSVEFTIVRQGQERKLTMTPEMAEIQGTGEKRWRVGIGSDPSEVTKLPLGAAFTKSLQENKRNSFLILELVQKMVRRKISMRQIEGPIGIGRASGEAAREGLAPLMQLAAMISLNLGVFNLFPIPILDGGVILMIFIEGLLRRDISLRVKERVYQVAFLFLVLFAVVVIYNDLVKTLPGLAQRLP